MPQPPATVVSNNKAIALWIFMAVWLGMLGCFTYIFARDGSPAEVGAFGLPLSALIAPSGLEQSRAIGPAEWDDPAAIAWLKAIISQAASHPA